MIGVPAGVEAGEGGADGDGLAGADFAGDHAEAAFADAPADAGDGFGVGGVAVQHLRREARPNGVSAEPVVGFELLDHGDTSVAASGRCRRRRCRAAGVGRGTCPSGSGSSGSARRVAGYCTGRPARRCAALRPGGGSRSRSAHRLAGWCRRVGPWVHVPSDPVRHRWSHRPAVPADLDAWSGRTGRTPARPSARPGRRRLRRCCRAARRCAVLVTVRHSDHKNASRSCAGEGSGGVITDHRSNGVWPVSEWVAAVIDGLHPRGEQGVQLDHVVEFAAGADLDEELVPHRAEEPFDLPAAGRLAGPGVDQPDRPATRRPAAAACPRTPSRCRHRSRRGRRGRRDRCAARPPTARCPRGGPTDTRSTAGSGRR